MHEATTLLEPELAHDLADLTVAELHAYIRRLRDYIQSLQDYNIALHREMTELQRREFVEVMGRA